MFQILGPLLIAGVLFFNTICAAAVVAPTMAGTERLEVPAACMDKLLASHEALQRLDFSAAEKQSLEAVAMYPEHPLPHLFVAGVYLYWIQENETAKIKDKTIFKKFHQVADFVLEMSQEQARLYPDSAYPWVYQGVAMGTQGMVNLYQSHYWTSYKQGKKAAEYLRKAVAMDPGNRDVYFGLGQFEYFCGRLAGVLRFFLRLHGDEDKGIRMMQKAAAEGTYATLPAKAFLSQILIKDRKDWKKAQPYADYLYGHYPESYYHVQNAIALSLGSGLGKDLSKRRLEAVCEQWDKGWRPPAYARVMLDPARLALARQYLKENKPNKAALHLKALRTSKDKSLAQRASQLLNELPRENF